jgi:hypothetical protein
MDLQTKSSTELKLRFYIEALNMEQLPKIFTFFQKHIISVILW